MLLSEANLMFNVLNASVFKFAMAHGLTLALKTATVVVVAGILMVAVAIAQESAEKSTFCTSIHSCSFSLLTCNYHIMNHEFTTNY